MKKKRSSDAKADPKVPHPVDDLARVEPVLDAKLKTLDVRKLGKLRRIARLERELTGGEEW